MKQELHPFFSVIIPTYNSEKRLSDCLESIINQTFQNFEIIIVDKFSSDDTFLVVEKYKKTHFNIIWISEKDNGIYDAMNKGIRIVKGEWIYFLGSDDRLYENTSLEKIANSIHQGKPDMIYGNVQIEGKSVWAEEHQIYNGEYTLEKLTRSNICHQAAFYKRESLASIGGFNIEYNICADWDINLNFFSNYKIQYTDQIIAFFCSSGISSFAKDKFLENDIVLKLQQYFGWSVFNNHFSNWKHLLKKNSYRFFKQGNLIKAFIYFAAFKYHDLKVNARY